MFTLSAFADEISPNLDEELEILEEEGIRYIDLRSINNIGVLDLSGGKLEEMREKLFQRGFKVSAIASPIGKVGIEENFEEHLLKFEKALFAATLFKTRYIRIFSFYMPPGEDPLKYREEVLRRIKIMVELATKRDLVLLLENERGIYGDRGERCQDILVTINSENLRAVYDPANYVLVGVRPYSEAYGLIKDYIVYVHVKDALFKDGFVVPAGEGDGELNELLVDLKKRDFDGFLSLEPHLLSSQQFGGFSGPKEFKRASKALKRLLARLG